MAIGLAESLLECDVFDANHMMRRFATAYAAEPRRSTVASELGRGSSAPESVPIALFCFLRHPGSFVDAVASAV